MARSFNHQGPSIAIGSLPDPSPNTTPPASNRIFNSGERAERGQEASTIQYALDMNTAGTADVTLWVKDRTTGKWYATATEIGVGDKELMEIVGLAGHEIFFQLTTAVTFATVAVRAEAVV
ncbi:MAG TPA: hypothetical protein VM238_14970 [Phycisphaerae bacterium]|nr:hypothetical protein [Phycisphaerae bacterium]